MTLPQYPNPITLTQIRDEFGATGEINLTELYAGGTYVPTGTVGFPTGGGPTNIPTSGAISLSNFYGSSALDIIKITSSGPFTWPSNTVSAAILMVAGGGAGGSAEGADGGGGGGAGGIQFIPSWAFAVANSTTNIVIGAGGATTGDRGNSGGNTTIGNIGFPDYQEVSGGGGGGGSVNRFGLAGGSGGGACGFGATVSNGGGSGISGQGYAGGDAKNFNSGGGGGGASSIGQSTIVTGTAPIITPGHGGAGLEILVPEGSTMRTWDGSSYGSTTQVSSLIVAGGGGGGRASSSLWPGNPGLQGGAGGNDLANPAFPGIANSGGGGGGAFADAILPVKPAGNGGSGVIYIILNPPAQRQSAISSFESSIVSYSAAPDIITRAGFTLNSDGTISAYNINAISENILGTSWHTSAPSIGIGSGYWVNAIDVGGSGSPILGTMGWQSMGTNNSWEVAPPGVPASTEISLRYLTLQISETNGGPIIAQATIQLSASTTFS